MKNIKKIIIVEDNPADLHLTKLAFNSLDVANEIIHVDDGQLLFDYLKITGTHRIAFILLDLNMPGTNGFQLLKKLKLDASEFKDVPIIVFTTSTRKADEEKCNQLGSDGYFVKPIDINEYFATIREITHFWLQPTEFFSMN